MGTGVTLEMVADGYDFLGVMLQSPFASYSDAVGEILATLLSRWLIVDLSGGNTLDNVDNIEGPRPFISSPRISPCVYCFLGCLAWCPCTYEYHATVVEC